MTGDWSCLSGTVYKVVQEELWVIGQVVLRGAHIVMPESLGKALLTDCYASILCYARFFYLPPSKNKYGTNRTLCLCSCHKTTGKCNLA